ncbi:MAG: nucleotidyltransferase domain-containing protein [Lachnospiraceae bacterium]|jgi:predicted nucleotidyltransferase|nr:nucleotidyltransferase domain-containing protein [Lachnospiraceae bacterium]MCI9095890.1 nucleotidyltransferase domain-containing protein [Lachnospiraceae bacterium]MCI9203900.1 nucleotidyltransferase domain-containing protein [Lachnospiraceae bacterium]
MNNNVFTLTDIANLIKPIVRKYGVKEIYLFGSYARGDADEDSDLDFLVFGGENFKLTMIFALAEELRETLKKNVDVFEINEINKDSDFYNTIMRERLFVA